MTPLAQQSCKTVLLTTHNKWLFLRPPQRCVDFYMVDFLRIYYLLHIIDEVKSSNFNLNICIANICVLSTSPQNLFEKKIGDFRPFLGYFPIQMYNHNTANYILACFSQDVPNRLCGPATCLCLVCRCIMLRTLLPFNLPVEWAYGWSTTIKPAS